MMWARAGHPTENDNAREEIPPWNRTKARMRGDYGKCDCVDCALHHVFYYWRTGRQGGAAVTAGLISGLISIGGTALGVVVGFILGRLL